VRTQLYWKPKTRFVPDHGHLLGVLPGWERCRPSRRPHPPTRALSSDRYTITDAYAQNEAGYPNGDHFYTPDPAGAAAGRVGGPLKLNFENGSGTDFGAKSWVSGYLYLHGARRRRPTMTNAQKLSLPLFIAFAASLAASASCRHRRRPPSIRRRPRRRGRNSASIRSRWAPGPGRWSSASPRHPEPVSMTVNGRRVQTPFEFAGPKAQGRGRNCGPSETASGVARTSCSSAASATGS